MYVLGASFGPLAITSLNDYLAFTASSADVLLGGMTADTTAVPEPRFYGLLLIAMLGFAGIVLKNRRRVAEIE